MRVLDLRGQSMTNELVNTEVPRAALDISKAVQEITPLLDDVKNKGEQALLEVAAKFGNPDPKPFRVASHELDQALEALKPSLRAAIQESIDRVRKVCQAVMPVETSVELAPGATVRQRWQPVDSVGLYVPGGKAVYPSSVVMNVVPAQVAGVPRLAIATPAQAEFGNRPHPVVLATAAMLGVTEVYNIGGTGEITIKELADTVIQETKSQSSIGYISYEKAYAPGFEDMQRRVPDISKIKKELNWAPKKNLSQIITDVVAHISNS